jgi:hypothetical protein
MLDLHHALYSSRDIVLGLYMIYKHIKSNPSNLEGLTQETLMAESKVNNLKYEVEQNTSKGKCLAYLLRFKSIIRKLVIEAPEAYDYGERTGIVTYSKFLKADTTEIILSSVQ